MPDAARAARPLVQSRLVTALTLARLSAQYAAFTILTRAVPLRALARLAWVNGGTHDPERRSRAITSVVRIGRATGASRGDCLPRALVLYRELSRAGYRPVLVAGLRREDGRTVGHAWVEVAGTPVADAVEHTSRFVRGVCFGERGRPLRRADDEAQRSALRASGRD